MISEKKEEVGQLSPRLRKAVQAGKKAGDTDPNEYH